jgi:hypothetical protein
VVVNALLSVQGCNIGAVFGGLLLGAGLLHVSERLLKPRWKSNRFVHLSQDSLHIQAGEKKRQEIDPNQQTNVYMWRFEVRRRTRVPKGWYVVAAALEQDDIYLPVYTVTSPEGFEVFDMAGHFTPLKSKKELDADGSGDLRLAGHQRRLLIAESARDLEGVEMSVDDFKVYLNWLQTNFPKWMPSR